MTGAESWKTWEGRVVDGKFPLRQWLGGSEHSAVFLTERQGQASPKVAIKLVAADSREADRQLARWRAAAQLSHPHLMRIFEAGRCQLNGTPLLYQVTEFAEEDLSQILPQRPLTPEEVAEMLPPLLDALSYVHARGFAHGDIRPSNVLAVGDQLKLSADQLTASTEASTGGNRRDVYDAPETAAGIVLPAGDLWSVGVTLVTALTQNAPFAGEASRDPEVPKAIPEPFRGIARECLRLDPKQRCSIANIQARLRPPARSVPAAPESPPPPKPRSKRGPVILALVAITMIAGLWVVFSGGKKNAPPAATVEQTSPQAAVQPATAPPARAPEPPRKATESRGEVVHQVLPDIPRSAMNTITGTIKVAVHVDVDPSGKVVAAKLTSPGPSKYFANLVLQAAQHWEFSAPDVNGQPTASAWLLRFRLKRSGTQVSPERVKH